MLFADRTDAGQRLGAAVVRLSLRDPVVLALPRGGVPVGFEVARALGAPLDVVVVRKIGAPFHPELGVGAMVEDTEPLLDERLLQRLGLEPEDLADTIAAERRELERRRQRYRGDRPLLPITGRSAVVVDDGLATGGTARAALRGLRQHRPGRLVLAVPVGSPESVASLRDEADDVVCLAAPPDFAAVGQFYARFEQTDDDTVVRLLERAGEEFPAPADGQRS